MLRSSCTTWDRLPWSPASSPRYPGFPTLSLLLGLDATETNTGPVKSRDNIEGIAGDDEWEAAVFHLYNRILETGRTRLFITGDRPPRQLNLSLPDLASRLDWGQIYKLQPLSDEEKLQALQLRAKLRGFELPEDVGRFLLKRLDREMRTLFMTLDQLDRASITAQRKLTIPFVKEILGL